MAVSLISVGRNNPGWAGRLTSEAPGSFLLSFVAGFADTAAFVALSGLFTSHITGNLVLAGAAIIQGAGGEALTRLVMLPIFMVAVALATFLAGFARSRKLEIAPLLLVCEVIFLIAFLVTGVLLTPPGRFEFDEMRTLIVGGCGVLAMGIQNALMREVFTTFLATNMMTGNFTQFTIDLSNLLRNLFSRHRSKDETNQILKRIRRYGNVLLGFLLGSAAGAFGVSMWHFWSVLLPLAVIVLLATATFARLPARTAQSLENADLKKS